jgi:2-polyprenyl-3-methyl-5-hydroxy-6-metoxy-1,4-benzoquinol methylase
MTLSNPEQIFEYVLGKLKSHFATSTIPEKLNTPVYNKKIGMKVCSFMFELCGRDEQKFAAAIQDFIEYSLEFLTLQAELEKTGHYRLSSYSEAQETVYQNPEVMDSRYLHGLLLSQALWINHHKMLLFFINEFCHDCEKKGRIIEVPVGTGIYISEFNKINNSWDSEGYDISISSVNFAYKIANLNLPSHNIKLRKRDVFKLSGEEKFDRIICGELLEHLEDPDALLLKLKSLLKPNGRLFLTTAIWAAAVDHIYLFKSADEVREMLEKYFYIEQEQVLTVFPGKSSEDQKTPLNYACILHHKK